MNSKTRALIALVLALAMPLRVYAAVAMEFCSVSHAGAPGAAEGIPLSGHAAPPKAGASMDGDHHAVALQDHAGRPDRTHAQPAHSGACASCCCAAVIAAAPSRFELLPSPPPLAPPFTRVAVVSFVPDGLDRPPQPFLA